MKCPECTRVLEGSRCACGWTDKKAVRASSVTRTVIINPKPKPGSSLFARFVARAVQECMFAPRGGFAKLYATLLRKWIDEDPDARQKFLPELYLWEDRVEKNQSWWNEQSGTVDMTGIYKVVAEFGPKLETEKEALLL